MLISFQLAAFYGDLRDERVREEPLARRNEVEPLAVQFDLQTAGRRKWADFEAISTRLRQFRKHVTRNESGPGAFQHYGTAGSNSGGSVRGHNAAKGIRPRVLRQRQNLGSRAKAEDNDKYDSIHKRTEYKTIATIAHESKIS